VTGSQLAAALMLGADGVNIGTGFIATKEAPVHDNIKQALVKGGVGSTELIMRSVRNTERVYKNKTSAIVKEIETKFPGDFEKIHPYVKGENYRVSFQETGDVESSVWSCGDGIALINDIPTCEEFLERMVMDAEAQLRKAQSFIV
jgi:NAD(P)H-dependent flavin oxidoreductase YrpB (nitropropane dioxygenase family)